MEVRGLRAYRRDTADLRESPALTILSRLDRAGAEVAYHDPHVPHIGSGRHDRLDLQSVPLTAETLAAADAVVIVTDHSAVNYAFVVRHARLVVDTRNATRLVTEGRDKILKASPPGLRRASPGAGVPGTASTPARWVMRVRVW